MIASSTTELVPAARLRVRGEDALAIVSIVVVGCLVYGVFVPTLGFYWDDWPVVWVYHTFGSAGVTKYFSGQRPAYGWIINHIAQIIGIAPLWWHIVALAVRCATSVAVYVALCALWTTRRDVAWLVATVVLLYPGFTLQPIALGFIPYFVSFLLFLVSLACTIQSINSDEYRLLFVSIALIAEGLSYVLMEYFVGLEFFRLTVITVLASRQISTWNRKSIGAVLITWAPYAAVLTAYVIWRSFIFHIVTGYGPTYMSVGSETSQVLSNPREIAARFLGGIHNIVMSTVIAWARPFNMDLITRTPSSVHSWVLAAIVVFVSVLAIRQLSPGRIPIRTSEVSTSHPARFLAEGLFLGVAALLFGGLPLLVSGLQINFTPHPSYADRFSIPFILGSSLTFALLLVSFETTKLLRVLLIPAFLFGFSAFQFRNGSLYRQEWYKQKSFFWQLTWRAPVLRPGTSLFVDGVPKSLIGNHSAGTLDLLYGGGDRTGRLDYFIFDLSVISDEEKFFAGRSVNYKPDEPMIGRVRSFEFEGTTSQSLVAWISPEGTLRLVSPEQTNEILRGSVLCQNLSQLSKPEETIADASERPGGPLLKIFREQPRDKWLFYYQRAELQRQLKHWKAIADLGDEAIRGGYYPSDLSEWFPFIDGYARTANYRLAADLSKKMLDKRPDALVPLSSLWTRVLREDSSNSPELTNALRDLHEKLLIGEAR